MTQPKAPAEAPAQADSVLIPRSVYTGGSPCGRGRIWTPESSTA